ncbi:MAG: hypothetical protein NZM31_13460 [Gemmatales bacterium]|nr:hypothetical protein [Gemmatales bacterium]MDW8388005.1 hypothetical protein [Gemmatales bacterium]
MSLSLRIALLLAGLLWINPAVWADEKTQTPAPPSGETADRLNRIERRLDDLEAQIKEQTKELQALKGLGGQVDAFRLRLDTLEKTLSDRLESIQRDLQALRVTQRPAYDLPDTSTQRLAQLQLVNTWDAPVLIVVDGTEYLLQPNQTRTISRRPGRFSYEVRQVDGRIIQPLRDSELRVGYRPHMIEVFPR